MSGGRTGLTLAIVATPHAPDVTGGATFEGDVLSALLSRELPHRLVVYPDTAAMRDVVQACGATGRVTLLPLLTEPGIGARIVLRSARALRREPKPQPFWALNGALLEHGVHAAWMLGGMQTALDVPYVATIWDLEHRRQPWFPEVSSEGEFRAREALIGECARRAAVMLVGTDEGARQVQACYGDVAGSIRVLPLPTPAFALAAAGDPMPARPPGMPARYVFYPATFWAHKNHVTLLYALRILRDRGDDAPALVCSGGDRGVMGHVRDTAASLGLADLVHFAGFVPRETLVALYRHADALVFPSLFGPDNLPPLEAMALGVPVIAADSVGAREQLGDDVVRVDGLDATAWADAIARVRGTPAVRAELVARGAARAASWDATAYVESVLRMIDERIVPMRALWA